MNNFESNNSLERLEKWADFVSNYIGYLAVLEIMLVIIIGFATKNLDTPGFETIYIVMLIISSIVLISLKIFNVKYQRAFPASAIDAVKNQFYKKELKDNVLRSSTLINLYENTLKNISDSNPEGYLSRNMAYEDTDKKIVNYSATISSLVGEFKDVFKPVIDNIEKIIDTGTTQISLGIYLNDRKKTKRKEADYKVPSILTLRDDNDLLEALPDDFDNLNHRGWQLDVMQMLTRCIQNNSVEFQSIEINDTSYMFIGSEINIDKGIMHQSGVFFLVFPRTEMENDKEGYQSIMKSLTVMIQIYLEKITVGSLSSGVLNTIRSLFGMK